MMKSKHLFWLLTTVLLITAALAEAQQPKKIPRIGYLSNTDPTGESTRSEAIRTALRELGYIEGQNINIEYRYSEGRGDRAPELAAELVRLKVDVIVAAGGPTWIQAAKNATKTIPIVMVGQGADPVEVGLIGSLARPGANLTGVTNLSGEIGGKRLELLKEAVPNVTRVAVLYDAANPVTVLESKKIIEAAAREFGLTVRFWEIRVADDLKQVFVGITKWRPHAPYPAGGGPLLNVNRKRIVEFALNSRLPSMHNRREFVEAGGLMSYGTDLADSYRRVAYYVDKILKGANPADLPVEQPTKFELVINLKTAKQIGLTIPSSVLARADKVIK